MFFLFTHPIYYLRTFSFSFCLPRDVTQIPGHYEQIFLRPPSYGTDVPSFWPQEKFSTFFPRRLCVEPFFGLDYVIPQYSNKIPFPYIQPGFGAKKKTYSCNQKQRNVRRAPYRSTLRGAPQCISIVTLHGMVLWYCTRDGMAHKAAGKR